MTVPGKLQKLNETLQIADVFELYKIFRNGKNIKMKFTLSLNAHYMHVVMYVKSHVIKSIVKALKNILKNKS